MGSGAFRRASVGCRPVLMGKIFSQYAGVESFCDPPRVEVVEVDADRWKSLGIRGVNRRFFELSVQLPALIFILVYRLRLLRRCKSLWPF